MIGAMTFHTKRWIKDSYSFNNTKINSAEDIKKFIWDKFKNSFTSEKSKNNFIKGISLCDFDALFKWYKNGSTQRV